MTTHPVSDAHSNRETILVWGAGAIGGVMGAYWARAGHKVLLVDINKAHVNACNQQGLHIEGPVEQFSQSVSAVHTQDVTGKFRRIILAVKAQHTEQACVDLLPHLEDDGYVLSAQNGLNETVIATVVGPDRVIGAFVNFGADWLAPGKILYGNKGAVVIGETNRTILPRTQALLNLLQDFDPDAILSDDIWAYLWGKMGYGAMLFATALTHESMNSNFADPARVPILIALAREVMQVADAEGVTPKGFNGYDPAAFHCTATTAQSRNSIAQLADFTANTAKTHTGIYRDIAVRKRRTEVDPQIGAIVSIADRHGIAVPLTRRLVELVHDVETGAREQSADTFFALQTMDTVSL
ncbi:MAG: ketopantoate reductase family protein [Granulosicoccus sp.]